MDIVALIEHDRGDAADVSFQALAFAHALGADRRFTRWSSDHCRPS